MHFECHLDHVVRYLKTCFLFRDAMLALGLLIDEVRSTAGQHQGIKRCSNTQCLCYCGSSQDLMKSRMGELTPRQHSFWFARSGTGSFDSTLGSEKARKLESLHHSLLEHCSFAGAGLNRPVI